MAFVALVLSTALHWRVRQAVLAMLREVLGDDEAQERLRLDWWGGEGAEMRRTISRRLDDLGVQNWSLNHWVRDPRNVAARIPGGYTLWLLAPGETQEEGGGGGRRAARVRIHQGDLRRGDSPQVLAAACDWALSPPVGQLVDAAAGFRRRARGEAGTRSWRLFDEGGGDWLLVCATDRAVDAALRWEEDTEEEEEEDDRLMMIDY